MTLRWFVCKMQHRIPIQHDQFAYQLENYKIKISMKCRWQWPDLDEEKMVFAEIDLIVRVNVEVYEWKPIRSCFFNQYYLLDFNRLVSIVGIGFHSSIHTHRSVGINNNVNVCSIWCIFPQDYKLKPKWSCILMVSIWPIVSTFIVKTESIWPAVNISVLSPKGAEAIVLVTQVTPLSSKFDFIVYHCKHCWLLSDQVDHWWLKRGLNQ